MSDVIALRRVHILHGEPAYWCPVCEHPHRVAFYKPFGNGAKWGWNKSFDKPTFTPSVLQYSENGVQWHWILKKDGVKKGTYPTKEEAEAAAEPGWTALPRRVGGTGKRVTHCHVHVTDGMLRILPDTPGPLGGKTVPLEAWDIGRYGS